MLHECFAIANLKMEENCFQQNLVSALSHFTYATVLY